MNCFGLFVRFICDKIHIISSKSYTASMPGALFDNSLDADIT